ncbi:hypothetical protein [Sporosarcina sp. A2]|uniref:hypothetical protein n=1 Tax=Sporosarcina sp. A2 TaxID=3393449 RepID=UPI003D7BB3B9
MNTVHAFFETRYNEIMRTKLGTESKYERLQVLHNDICKAYMDKLNERPHALLQEIELQIC